MAKTFYVQNTYTSDIQIDLRRDGRYVRSVVFPRYQVNKATGQIISDGHLEVDEELLEQLKSNGAFKLLTDKKRLVVKDEAPVRAGSFEQLMNLKARVKALEEENAQLKEKLAEYEGGNAKADDGLDKMKLDELKAKAMELGLDAEGLTKKADVIDLIRKGAE